MKKIILSLLISTLSLSFVTSANATMMEMSPESVQTFMLKVGESATMGDVVLKLMELNDSRCPANARCIWAGQAKAKFEAMLMGGQKISFEMILNHAPASMMFRDLEITMTSVDPYPGLGRHDEEPFVTITVAK